MRIRSLNFHILAAVALAAAGALALYWTGVAGFVGADPPRAAQAPHRDEPIGKPSGVLVEETNLQRMAEAAGVIVRARVAAVREEPHPEFENLNSVVVTLEVRDSIKGGVGSLYTFRQYSPSLDDRGTMLGYAEGQDLVLLLTRPSRSGFSSPVALALSVFRVEVDAENRAWVTNGMDNMGLFEGMRQSVVEARGELDALTYHRLLEHRQGPMRYDDFREALRILGGAAARRGQ